MESRDSLWVQPPIPTGVPLTPEARRLYRLAGWVGELTDTSEPPIGFTSLLIAFLLAEDRVSRWFRTIAGSSFQERLLAERHVSPELREKVLRSEQEAPDPPMRRDGWTPSAVKVLLAAQELAGSAPIGPEHLMAAYILRPPSGHDEDYRRWGIDTSAWEVSFHAQSFLGEGTRPSSPDILFAQRPLTPALTHVLALATRFHLRHAQERPWLTTTDLLLAVVEHGRAWDDSGRFLFQAIQSSEAGAPAYARLRGEFQEDTLPHPPTQPVALTPNVVALASLAEELHRELTGTGPLALRHLVAAMLLHEASGGSGLEARFREFGLDRRALRESFLPWLQTQPTRNGSPSDDLRGWRARLRPESDALAERFPWISVDTPGGDDRLGFRKYAGAFAALIASTEVATPLAIGVFGEWGSGKSFFMRLIEHHVQERQEEARQSPGHTRYLSDIAHIHFNAWQYMESNLWASLAEHVFRSLAEELSKRDVEAKLDFEELETARALRQQAETERQEAREALQKAEKELKSAQEAHEEAAAQVAGKLWGEFNPSLPKEVDQAIRELFGAEALTTARHLRAAYDDLRDGSRRMRKLMSYVLERPPSVWGVLGLLVGVLALIVLVSYVPLLEGTRARLASASAVLVPVYSTVAWLAPRLKQGARTLREMEKGAREANEAIAEAEARVAKARSRLEAARASLEAATKRTEDARQRAALAEAAAKTPRTAERIARFIEERIRSEEYRRELGVLHLVRRDFERLSKLLTEHRKAPREPPPDREHRGLERIVLYIDDLDRCPQERVVQVLEAVHLLLAFDLFVVIVAVDGRWVHDALLERFPFLREHPGAGHHASAHDYLEKIFQLPFWLPELDDTGCRELISSLLSAPPSTAPPVPSSLSAPPPTSTPSSPPEQATRPADTSATGASASAAEGQAPPSARSGQPPPVRSEALEIDTLEIQYMHGLVEHFPSSPRRVKRLLNTYRLLKATTTREEYVRFVNDEQGTGPYQGIITLLTLVIGAPRLSHEVLRWLEAHPKLGLDALLQELQTRQARDGHESAERQRILGALGLYQRTRHHPTLDELARWAPRVARYSFLALAPDGPAEETPTTALQR